MNRSIFALSLVILVGGFSSAHAGSNHSSAKSGSMKSMMMKVKDACAADIKKHCSDVTQGEGRIAACLDSKSDKLSQNCNTARSDAAGMISKKMDKANVAFRKSCGSDVQKFCSDVPSGRGRIMDCLSEHKDDLSNSCKDLRTQVDKKLDEAMAAG